MRQVEELASLAARTGMRELVVRAHLHGARLGDEAAFIAATALAAQIDSPRLTSLVEGEPAATRLLRR